MGNIVTLEYRRVDHHYEGCFKYLEVQESFSHEYAEMLKRLCNILEKNFPKEEDVDIVLQRTDRAGLTPVSLSNETVLLLRTNPVAGIAALTYTQPQTPLGAVAKKKAETTVFTPPPLRAGVDTLAQAFGPLVYVRVRDGKAECPCCGFWIRNILQVPDGGVADITVVCTERCKNSFELRAYSKWAAVSVAELLDIKSADRFYLPREWNYPQVWVSRTDLQTKYDMFTKEKEKAHG